MTTWLTNNEVFDQLKKRFPLEELIIFCKINASFHRILYEEAEIEELGPDKDEQYEFMYWEEKAKELIENKKR